MNSATARGQIRGFGKEDIPQVADLHRRVFQTADRDSPELMAAYRSYFTQVFLDDDSRDDDTRSLVYEEEERITGFFGAVARRMSFQGQTVRVKLGSQAVVDPDRRGLAGLKLYSAFLEGPHDLFIGDEANANSRQLWEGLGGVVSLPYSMYWLYPIRPCQFARFALTGRRLVPPFLARVSAPVTWALDGLARPILKRLSGSSVSGVFGVELTCETMLACLTERARARSLQPVYDQCSLGRLLQRAGGMRRKGCLQKVLLKTEAGAIAGWYLYYPNPKGVGEVIQLYANPGSGNAVLNHLIQHAESQGAALLRGRLEPSLLSSLSDKHCLFHFGPAMSLFYSKRPELLQALAQGDAFFSRLDGEWCLHFQ